MEKYKNHCQEKFVSSPLTRQHLLFNLQNLDRTKLYELLENEWDDLNVLNGMELIFCALLSFDLPGIYRHFLKLKKVLGVGVQGIAIAGNIGSSKRSSPLTTIALKSANAKGNNPLKYEENLETSVEDLEREFLIGWELNKLHSPIFPRFYGYINCFSPLVTTTTIGDKKIRNLENFCPNGGKTIVQQYIPGKNYWEVIPTISSEEFLKSLVVLSCNLEEAFAKCGFVHCDLHPGNVMERFLPDPWTFSVRQFWLKSQRLLVVIDFGFSRIKIGSKIVFKEGFENYKINDTPSEIYDVYKFVMSVLNETPHFEELKFLASFFYPKLKPNEITKDFINGRKIYVGKRGYYFPTGKISDLKLKDFIDFLLSRPEIKKFLDPAPPLDTHQYGEYSEPIDFFQDIGIDLSSYGGLKDSYQWFVYQQSEHPKSEIKKDLATILPKEIENLKRLLKEFSTLVDRGPPDVSTTDREEVVEIINKIADYTQTIYEETTVLLKAVTDCSCGLEVPKYKFDLSEFGAVYDSLFPENKFIFPIPYEFISEF